MKFKVLGSGSSGNCYILENETEALVIEAGLPFKEVKRALDFNVRKIVGVIASHAHKDHSKYLNEYVGVTRIFRPYEVVSPYEHFGNFYVKPFPLIHDVECYGFYIEHPEMGNLIYASDTEYIKYRFRNLNHILVECNYDKGLIPDDAVNRSHVLQGHMELQTTKEFVKVNNNPELRNVVLLHLSDKNSDEIDFIVNMEEVIDASTKVWIAKKRVEIPLDLLPF